MDSILDGVIGHRGRYRTKKTVHITDEMLSEKKAVVILYSLLFEALRYKPEDRGFDSRWCH